MYQTTGCGILYTCNGDCEFKRVEPTQPDYRPCKYKIFNDYESDYCGCEEAHQALLKSLTQNLI